MTTRVLWFAALLGALAVGGCANLKGYEAAGPTPVPSGTLAPGVTPSPTPTGNASPVPCNSSTPANTSNVVYVGMSFAIAPTSDPTFGPLAGFGDASSGEIPQFAGRIDVAVGDIVQFVNVENIGAAEVFHDAVGFGSAASFPAAPFAFGAGTAAGTTISGGTWATGQIESYDANNDECLSQTFTVPSLGSFLFGDEDYYNSSSSLRGVIVVTQTAAQARRSRALRRSRVPWRSFRSP